MQGWITIICDIILALALVGVIFFNYKINRRGGRMKEKILLIDWIDSSSASGWQPKSECKVCVCTCRTIGFLVDENKDFICIALNKTTTETHQPYGDLMTIPKVAIKKITRILT